MSEEEWTPLPKAPEMVERVAFAILRANGADPEKIKARSQYGNADHWTPALEVARAAIEAMREPTAEMSTTGKHTIKGAADLTEREQAEYAWRSMIDAALKEKPE